MDPERSALLFDQFAEAADSVARARPGVDRDVARELLLEAATMLHNGLVLDELDDHDYAAVVADLSLDLTAVDPAAAVRQRAQSTRHDTALFHDPDTVAATHLSAAATLQL
jgi:hypothetical protein